MVNKVHKVIIDGNSICFIIKTEGDDYFWWWQESKYTWNEYWKDKNSACLIGKIMEWAADEFVNADEDYFFGCSCAAFETVMDAVNDYMYNWRD